MSVKAQLSPPRGIRWNVVLDNNRRELWQFLVSVWSLFGGGYMFLRNLSLSLYRVQLGVLRK